MSYSRLWPGLLGVVLLVGCKVGPKYTPPTAPMTPAYKEAPPESYKESDQWKKAQPMAEALRGNWWELFGDPQLNALELQVAVSNQNIKAEEARFREARTLVRYNRAAKFPTISVAPSAADVHLSANEPFFRLNPNIGSVGEFIVPVDLSWELDLWGRIRRAVAAAGEEAQATAADLASLTLSLQAEVAYDYFELRSADSQKRLLDATVEAYIETLKLTTDLYKGGAVPETDVVQAQTQLDTVRVQDTDIWVMRAQYEHAIAVLIGKPPAEFSLRFSPLNIGPPVIPVGLPSQLLERRPDIAANERRVAEANEQIGIARAAYFPTVSLNATGGFEGTSLANVFTWPSRFWSIGPTAVETIFDAGRRRATSDAARDGFDLAVANYRETTLTAFQEVEDNLAALRILEQEAHQQRDAVVESKKSVELFTLRYTGGTDPYLNVVTAQTIELANERNEVDILRRRMDATVLLIKGLGGGWNALSLPPIRSFH